MSETGASKDGPPDARPSNVSVVENKDSMVELAKAAANGDLDEIVASFGDSLPEIEGEILRVWITF